MSQQSSRDRLPGLVLVGPSAVLGLWAMVTYTQLISPLFLATPHSVALQLWQDLSSGRIIPHVCSTLFRVAVGCGMGILLGVPLGLALGYWRKAYECSEIVIDFFRSIPIACLFPLFLVLFGIGDKAKIGTAAWASTFVVLLNTMYGVRGANRTRVMVAQSARASQLQIFRKVLLPEALPNIVVGIRTAVSLALVVVLVTEMFMGTERGLGRDIYDASLVYRTPQLYAGIFLAGLLGYALNKAFVLLEERIIHWRRR
jgi:ABC-type nitrate/sulfonate/bicarbonate transport system permease component